MALVSDIEIRLRADIARLQQDMDRARQQVGSAMSRITQLAKGAGAALAAIGAGVAVGALANFVKQAIDATDAVSDISQRTGVAIKDIAALQLWFQKGGNEAGVFEGAMIKLSRSIAEGNSALESIGVRTRDANGNLRSNVDVLLDSADAFAKLEDGTMKTALAIDAFGKSGAQLIPLLNEGSEGLREMQEMADKLGLTFDQKTVDAAGDFNDTLDFLGLAAQGVGRKVAAELLPTLNSLVGSLLNFVTSGNGVQTAAQTIAAGFKIIYTVGVSVVTLFTTLGKVIAGSLALVTTNAVNSFEVISRVIRGSLSAISSGADGAMSVLRNLASGDIKGAWNAIGEAGKQVGSDINSTFQDVWGLMQTNAVKSGAIVSYAFDDITEGLSSAGKAISDVWSGQGDLAISAFATITSSSAATADAVEKDAKKQKEALDTVNKILEKSNKDLDDLQQQLVKNYEDLARERYSMIDSARAEAEQNEFLAETFGMTESAVIRLQASRLLEQEAQRLGRDLTKEEIEDLERVIELKERSAKAVANRAELEQTKQFWTDIEKTARDTFVSIADGGKNAFQRLKDTAKNTFFDWLYQQTLKKWIINIGTSVTGTTGLVGGAAAAVGGSSSGGISGSIGSAAGIAGLLGSAGAIGAGALQTAGAVLAGHIGLGSTISAGVSALASGTAAGVSAGLSSLAGTLGPIALGIAGAVTLISKAFGRSGKQTTASGIAGTFGAEEFMGNSFRDWIKKGGWFRSDKTGTDTSALNPEQAQALNSAYKAIKDSTASFAAALGVPADVVFSYSKTIRLALTGDEAKDQEMLTQLFADMGDELATRVIPNISQFIREGETAATTLERVANNFAGVELVLAAMGTDSQTAFRAVGLASIEARERLVAFAGGLESLASQTVFFNDNFLSEAERIAMIQGPLNKQMEELGLAGLTTTDQFKSAVQQLVQSGALATEEGAKRYAQLLAIAPQFKTVADYLKELSDTAADTAKELAEAAAKLKEQQLIDSEKGMRDAVDFALEMVKSSVDAQKNEVTRAYDEVMDRIGTRIDGLKDKINDLTSLSDAIRGARTSVVSEEQQIASRSAARAQVQAAIAIAKASGVLPSVDSLKDALATIKLDASDQFSSLADYQREVARTNAELDALGGMTEKQLTDAQRQILLLEDQKTIAQQQYDAEIDQLDKMAAWAQAEVDAINGVDRSVQTVAAAIAGLKVATQAYQQGAKPSTPNGSGLTIDQLYKTVLGRDADAAGLKYWQSVFGNGPVDAKGYADFIKGAQPELDMLDRQNRQAAAANMSGTMSSSSASNNTGEMADMKSSMARTAAAVEQLANQFNQVSGGGNSLLTEVA